MLKTGLRFLGFVLVFCLFFDIKNLIARSPAENTLDVGHLYYQLQPLPTEDRTDMLVTLSFKSDTAVVINLPSDYYGTPRLFRYITEFSGLNGTIITRTTSDDSRRVTPDSAGVITINYGISYDPVEMDRYAYAPITRPTFFHVAGCQWLLSIGPDQTEATYHVTIDPLADWTFYSSKFLRADSFVVEATYENMATLFIGGSSGKEVHETINVKGRPVDIFIQGQYDFDDPEVIDGISRIASAERMWFNDFSQPFYNISILPRTGLLAGTASDNYFVCFIDQATSEQRLYRLVAHEMFHYWLPGKLEIRIGPDDCDFKHDWFHEGFTDYLSWTILRGAHLINPGNFVEMINQDVVALANNPSAHDTYQDLCHNLSSGEFRTAQKKLAYYKGALLALRFDILLKGHGHTLHDFILELYRAAGAHEGKISFDKTCAIGDEYNLNIAGEYSKFIAGGADIPLPESAFPDYQLKEQTIRLFDPGFNMRESGRTRLITGVTKDGPAYEAGLRDGMTYVKRKNSNRFSNSWSESKPLVVTVLLDSAEVDIAYFPVGDTATVMLYRIENDSDSDQ